MFGIQMKFHGDVRVGGLGGCGGGGGGVRFNLLRAVESAFSPSVTKPNQGTPTLCEINWREEQP